MKHGCNEFVKFIDINGPSNLTYIMSVIGMQDMVSRTRFRRTLGTWCRTYVA